MRTMKPLIIFVISIAFISLAAAVAVAGSPADAARSNDAAQTATGKPSHIFSTDNVQVSGKSLDFWLDKRSEGRLFPIPPQYKWKMTNEGGFGAPRARGRSHAGYDIRVAAGTEVVAMEGGVIVEVLANFYGGTSAVSVLHQDGSVARYCEIRPSVRSGAKVKQGEVLGKVIRNSISGGTMLHLEVYYGSDANGNPLKGGLTDRDNDECKYYFTNSRNYLRRGDLLDPTGVLLLAVTPAFKGELDGDTSAAGAFNNRYEGLVDDSDTLCVTPGIYIDGEPVYFEAYFYEGANYLRIRDLASALNGTDKQFDVAWDEENAVIVLDKGIPYAAADCDTSANGAPDASMTVVTQTAVLEDEEVPLSACGVGGRYYYRLRDLAWLLDFNIAWYTDAGIINIRTDIGYED